MAKAVFALAALLVAGPAVAQRLDGPEIAVDCKRGPGILRLCHSGCRAEADSALGRKVGNSERLARLDRCLSECWGISKALEDCSQRK